MKKRKSIIFGPPKPTKNQRYVAAQRKKGLRPITGWIPEHAYDDAMAQLAWLCDMKAKGEYYIPAMARDIGSINKKSTGKMRKSN